MRDILPFYTRHRGPFVLQVVRETPKTKYRFSVDTLKGSVDGVDVDSEARALILDPRDSIVSVYVWSEPEQQHVCTYRREDNRG